MVLITVPHVLQPVIVVRVVPVLRVLPNPAFRPPLKLVPEQLLPLETVPQKLVRAPQEARKVSAEEHAHLPPVKLPLHKLPPLVKNVPTDDKLVPQTRPVSVRVKVLPRVLIPSRPEVGQPLQPAPQKLPVALHVDPKVVHESAAQRSEPPLITSPDALSLDPSVVKLVRRLATIKANATGPPLQAPPPN